MTEIKVTLDSDVVDLRSYTYGKECIIQRVICPHSFVAGACDFLGRVNPYPEGVYFFKDEEKGVVIYYSQDSMSSDMIRKEIPSNSKVLIDESVPNSVIDQAILIGLTVQQLDVKLVTIRALPNGESFYQAFPRDNH